MQHALMDMDTLLMVLRDKLGRAKAEALGLAQLKQEEIEVCT